MALFYVLLSIHILAAMTWVGGMLFLSLAAVPALREVEMPQRARLLSLVGRRFRWVGWASISVLVATGLLNLAYYGVGPEDLASSAFWGTRFGTRLAIKLALVGAMLVLSALHDFLLGPRSTARSQGAADPLRAASFRRRVSWLARVTLFLAILVVGISVSLTR